MFDEGRKSSISVTMDQHEAIIAMKRGKDTVYDVIDRLLAPPSVQVLEESTESLLNSIFDLETEIENLRTEMMKNV